MNAIIYVAAGGAIGAVMRYGLSLMMMRRLCTGFPYGTLCANILGSFIMGLLFGYVLLRHGAQDSADVAMVQNLKLFLGVGVLGGFTTFSSFSIEAVMMLERKAYGSFSAYIGLSLSLSLLAVIAGLWIMRMIASSGSLS